MSRKSLILWQLKRVLQISLQTNQIITHLASVVADGEGNPVMFSNTFQVILWNQESMRWEENISIKTSWELWF